MKNEKTKMVARQRKKKLLFFTALATLPPIFFKKSF